MSRVAAALASLRLASAGDPSTGWLSYARFDSDDHNAHITMMNASWIVPEAPSRSGANPALWWGIQTYKGDGALVQPILKWYGEWKIFHEIYDWTDGHGEQKGDHVTVQTGDKITSSVVYRASDNSYDMYMTSANLGRTLTYNYKLESRQSANEATAYIVLEHQPSSCSQLPRDGGITFTDISVEVEGKKVASPKWTALQERPKCSSQAVVVDSATVKIEWNPSETDDEFPTFAQWAANYDKVYDGDETEVREAIFNTNIEEIKAHNAKGLSWSMGVNQFTDLTEDEFIATFTGEKPVDDFPHVAEDADVTEVPDEIDWTTRGTVNQITDQGSCGSCWAFSATATLESSYQLATGNLYKLAEQQLVDCDKRNSGCNGGSRDTGLMYWENGACSRASYPYKATGGSCQASSCTKQVPAGAVTGVVDVQTRSPSALKTAVAGRPVSISVNAGKLKAYANGVVHNDCNSMSHNHAIVTVGYGSDNGDDYFKVRNSWGTSWGEAGYIRLAQQGGTYGTACMLGSAPSYPKISAEVTV